MLLAIGLWVVVGGYVTTVWGIRVASGTPQTWAYLAGFSNDPNASTPAGVGGPSGLAP